MNSGERSGIPIQGRGVVGDGRKGVTHRARTRARSKLQEISGRCSLRVRIEISERQGKWQKAKGKRQMEYFCHLKFAICDLPCRSLSHRWTAIFKMVFELPLFTTAKYTPLATV